MFCPNCQTEYEDWVKECADCKVILVPKLEQQAKKELIKTNTKMNQKLLIIGNILFPVYIIFMCIVMISFGFLEDMEEKTNTFFDVLSIFAMLLFILSLFGTFFFIVYDMIHVLKNELLSDKAKIKWVFAIYFLNIFIMPVYWIKYLRKK